MKASKSVYIPRGHFFVFGTFCVHSVKCCLTHTHTSAKILVAFSTCGLTRFALMQQSATFSISFCIRFRNSLNFSSPRNGFFQHAAGVADAVSFCVYVFMLTHRIVCYIVCIFSNLCHILFTSRIMCYFMYVCI